MNVGDYKQFLKLLLTQETNFRWLTIRDHTVTIVIVFAIVLEPDTWRGKAIDLFAHSFCLSAFRAVIKVAGLLILAKNSKLKILVKLLRSGNVQKARPSIFPDYPAIAFPSLYETGYVVEIRIHHFEFIITGCVRINNINPAPRSVLKRDNGVSAKIIP